MAGKTSTNEDPNGWRWVFRKNKQEMAHSIRNPFEKEVEKIATSLFVTNFPEHIDAKGLWKVCESYGRIVDSYIANKRSKAGKRFGFVRFLGVKNQEEFAKSLANIWIGHFHMYASVARFKRQAKPTFSQKEGLKQTSGHTSAKHNGKHGPVNSQFKTSYASVLNGGGGTKTKYSSMEKKKISLSDHEMVQVTDSLEVALVKVKNVDSMSNMYRLCRDEGFDNVKIHHIGGLWLWMHFHNVESCNSFKNNTNMKSLFTAIKPVSKNFRVDERMVWVEISGLPLCAWGSNAFKKVASSVGKFMFFEDDHSAAMSIGRVCIATKQMKFISEVVEVVINGEEFDAHIHELGSWSISIDDDHSSDSSESVFKEDERVSNDDGGESEGDMHETFQEEQECKGGEETVEPENLGESIHINVANVANEVQGEDINQKTEEVKEMDGSDLSCPPGFEHLKNAGKCSSSSSVQPKTSKCSTSFQKYRKKDVRGISIIHEMSRLIEVGEKLGYDVKGCHESLHRLIDGIGVSLVDR
ncbi:hypothetical protein CTI12_AA160070 [Artemisia annua]|uniref:RRM domain-containing protein n=1 Tax=Artemisia annua TaxID=35608 RepID=A0A2U1PF62_ARTAN|nr:hypothetical protein CTI12_AA160070 [Artemisia annua]